MVRLELGRRGRSHSGGTEGNDDSESGHKNEGISAMAKPLEGIPG